MTYDEKKAALKAYIAQLASRDIVLAFSGGVDSSLLLKMCCEATACHGTKVYAVTIHTQLHPMNDLEISKRVAKEMGAEHLVIRVDELDEADIVMNPVDRCYRCKRVLFQKLKDQATAIGAGCVIDGTNEDDMHVYRPGIKALGELGVVSPLAKFGITKQEVRRLAEEYGVSVAQRPSTPCMATRFPYGTKLSYEAMRKVDEAEQWLRGKGFYNVRLRIHGHVARIEVDKDDMTRLVAISDEVVDKLKSFGYDYITLDMEGFRSGSMDINIKQR